MNDVESESQVLANHYLKIHSLTKAEVKGVAQSAEVDAGRGFSLSFLRWTVSGKGRVIQLKFNRVRL